MKTRELIVDDPNLSAFGQMVVELEGTAPLLQHRFGAKARKMMLDKQMGKTSSKKAPKVPEDDCLESLIVIGPRPKSWDDVQADRKCKIAYAITAAAFKAALVNAAKQCGFFKTDARTAFFVEPDGQDGDGASGLLRLHVKQPPRLHEAPVRISGTADLRHRPIFDEWGVTLRINFNARLLSPEQLLAIVKFAGVGVGVLENRPQGKNSSGDFGTWKVTRCVVQVPDLTNFESLGAEEEPPKPRAKATKAAAMKAGE